MSGVPLWLRSLCSALGVMMPSSASIGAQRRARARREIAVRLAEVALHRLLEARRLAVAGEALAVDALPRLAGEILRGGVLREAGRSGAGDECCALFEKSAPALGLFNRCGLRGLNGF